MEIKMVTRIIDDRGRECAIGDSVLIQSKTMDDPAIAVITDIRTNLATFQFDDRVNGYTQISLRPSDILGIHGHNKPT